VEKERDLHHRPHHPKKISFFAAEPIMCIYVCKKRSFTITENEWHACQVESKWSMIVKATHTHTLCHVKEDGKMRKVARNLLTPLAFCHTCLASHYFNMWNSIKHFVRKKRGWSKRREGKRRKMGKWADEWMRWAIHYVHHISPHTQNTNTKLHLTYTTAFPLLRKLRF